MSNQPPPYREGANRPVQSVQQISQPAPPATLEEQPLKQKTQIVYVSQIPSTQKVIVSQPGPGEQQPLTQQSQPSVQYIIDSSGHRTPITTTAQSQPTIIQYVDQYGHPVPAPTQQQVPQPVLVPTQENKQPNKNRKSQIAVCVIASFGVLMVFIGLCLNNLSRYEAAEGLESICGWTGHRIDCDDTIYYDCAEVEEAYEFSYGELCTSKGEDQKFCDTEIAAAISLVTMILAVIEGIIGVILIQPWQEITRFCAEDNKYVWSARLHFSISILFSVLSIILWNAIDELCTDTVNDVELGGSQICNVVGMVFIAIALSVMFVTKI